MIGGRGSGQGGFTLVEVMLVSSLFLVILGATLTSFTRFQRTTHESERTAEHVNVARETLDRGARYLRNIARRIDVPVVERALGDDLVFQTSSPDRRWMRYCLESAAPRTRLWVSQTTGSTLSSAMLGGSTGACPGTGWSSTAVAAQHVINASQPQAVPLFAYRCTEGAPAGCPRATDLSADSNRLKHVDMTLLIDTNTRIAPEMMRVSTSVFLRNQNEPPVASFTWSRMGSRRVLLNGSASSDPEGRTLLYYFFRDAVPTGFNCHTGPPATAVYLEGVAPMYQFAENETSATFTLVVCDAGGLQGVSNPQVVSP